MEPLAGNLSEKDANYILAEAGIKVDFDVRVIILRADKIHPFVVKENADADFASRYRQRF